MKRESILAFLRTELACAMPEGARRVLVATVAEIEMHCDHPLPGACAPCHQLHDASRCCPFLDRLHAALGLDAAGAKTGGA